MGWHKHLNKEKPTHILQKKPREAIDYWPCRLGQHEILPINTYHNVLKTRIMINQTQVIFAIFMSIIMSSPLFYMPFLVW